VNIKLINSAFIFLIVLAMLAFGVSRAVAQEGEMTVVDEVIVQVNDDVITLSMLKRETRERIEALTERDDRTAGD
jgi:hypothetical protein